MTSIKLKFRPSIFNTHGTVLYQVIHNRTSRQITSRHHIRTEEWDAHSSTIIVCPNNDRKAVILSIRDQIHGELEQLRNIASRLEKNTTCYSADDVVEEFKRYVNEYTFFNSLQTAITRLRIMGKHSTADNYRSALNSFRKFTNGQDIPLNCITAELMERYQAWLMNRGICPNTVSFYIRIFRAVYRRAVENEIIRDRNPFKHVYTGIDKTAKRAMPLPLLRKIKALDLTNNDKLDYARDIFFMSLYLRGMSFVDMCFLRKSDLNGSHVSYRRRKTGQRLTIAWTKEMQQILDKYPQHDSDYLLPIITRKDINERYAYKNAGYKVNRCLKKIAELAGESSGITMYMARHSWASLAKAKGIPITVISQAMGHDNETTTQIYLSSLETTVVDKANELIISLL